MSESDCTPTIYKDNIDFWDRAWNMVKTPYTQMPDLSYLERIPTLLSDIKSAKILDLGCGSGWLSIYLARQDFQVVGVDVATHALELGRMWAEHENLSIDFQVQDISNLQFPEGYFKAVVANSIFEHLTFKLAQKTILNLEAIVSPGGLFFGCFDKVGTGPGEFYKLDDGSQIYTDKGRRGMLLRCFSDQEIKELFKNWQIEELTCLENGSRILIARK
ncbi:MAG: class I SAM-dependent methyltransferase [Candidatus Obscuribacterales bacterium]|nr:class I SAM-dependent methyltransferase [Candidatus Obscuribacterales bacterium]